jgi:tetratricopeptide (TPR) repeat protein
MEPAEVEALYADALFSNPTNAFADYFLANFQWRMARGDSASPYHQKAKDSYESALRKDFGLTDCMSRLGVLAMESGQMDSAIRFFRTSIARRATAGKYAQLARVYLESARKVSEENIRTPLWVHARTCYERASSLDPTFLGAPLGFGYLESLKGNLIEAEEQFRDAQERYQEEMASVTDASARDLLTARSREFLDHAKICRASIRDNLSKWQWADVFARSDDMNIYRKWQEKEDRGVQVRIENQQAVFQGISSVDYGITLMAQATHAEEFVEFRATLDLSEASDSWSGIGLFSGRKNEGLSGLYFGRSWKGKLVVASVNGESLPEWTILGNWTAGDPVQIAIRSTSKRRQYDLLLNGEVVARDVRVQVPFSGGGFRVGVFGMARRNRSYRIAVSEARFIFRRREQ